MTKLLGEASSPLSFWLAVLLAVALLVGVSTTLARADPERTVAPIDRDLGGLRALVEELRRAGPRIPATLLVHPPLFDGSERDLKTASVRRVKAMRRSLDQLRPGLTGDPEDEARGRMLTLELDGLYRQLVTLDLGRIDTSDDGGVDLDRSLERMHAEWTALSAGGPSRQRPGRPDRRRGSEAPAAPRVLRGTTL